MTHVTVRDLRLHWPSIERQLASASGPIVITRDGEPVAQIAPFSERATKRSRFSAAQHARWLQEVWKGGRPNFASENVVATDRSERRLS